MTAGLSLTIGLLTLCAQRALGVKCVAWNQSQTHSEAWTVSYKIVQTSEWGAYGMKPKVSWGIEIYSTSEYHLSKAREALQKVLPPIFQSF